VPIIRTDDGIVRQTKIDSIARPIKIGGSLKERNWVVNDPELHVFRLIETAFIVDGLAHDPEIDGLQLAELSAIMVGLGLRPLPSMPEQVADQVRCRRCHIRLREVQGITLRSQS
jgi:hypothetical protein